MSNRAFFDQLAERWDDDMRAPDHERIIRLVEMIGLRPGDRVEVVHALGGG